MKNKIIKFLPITIVCILVTLCIYIIGSSNLYSADDYNYSNITKLFGNKSHTTIFIKKIACFPYNVQLNDIEELNKTFKHEEIMHLIALVAVIKSRVQLVYMIRAMSDVIKSID